MKKKSDKKADKKIDKKKLVAEIEGIVKELLGRLGVEGEIKVSPETNQNGEHFRVNITTSESGLLIGYHGETINSLQLLLGVILYKRLKEWVRVVVDVGDYRKMREDSIKEMVNRIVSEVEQSGREVELPYLSPLERRIVHMMLTNHEKVTSVSAGEGKDRRITIAPR